MNRYCHVSSNQLVKSFQRAGYKIPYIKKVCNQIVDSCMVCARSGLPSKCKKVSLSHVCQAFNIEIQADFMFVDIRKTKYCVLHTVDTGTQYSKCSVFSKGFCKMMAIKIKRSCLLRQGAHQKFSADSEFTKGPMKCFLTTHNTVLDRVFERPVRLHNKAGIVGRKHRTVKLILERLQHDVFTASNSVLLTRTTFLSNFFCGSSLQSSFELVRGYTLALLGANSKVMQQYLPEVHRGQQYVRVLRRSLRFRQP